ncbi:hypothetical protein E2C01_079645 [Portunus trituberculatus]|uniref:Uncharacterized protein n=1 Tax=Portunus trituberculatus TaxID=210409 RepID=A0A5B7IR53_PORTR|nr:hypothetical protein [Portunus trituberculatus]
MYCLTLSGQPLPLPLKAVEGWKRDIPPRHHHHHYSETPVVKSESRNTTYTSNYATFTTNTRARSPHTIREEESGALLRSPPQPPLEMLEVVRSRPPAPLYAAAGHREEGRGSATSETHPVLQILCH